MTAEQIKQNAEEYAKRNEQTLINKDSHGYLMTDYSNLVEAYIAGANGRDEEVENLEKLLDKAVHMLKDTYAGSDFFCNKLMADPEEDRKCMAYCDKEDILCDCVLRYLKHCIKKEE